MTSWAILEKQGRIVAEPTSRQEMLELRRMVARDLADAEAKNISAVFACLSIHMRQHSDH